MRLRLALQGGFGDGGLQDGAIELRKLTAMDLSWEFNSSLQGAENKNAVMINVTWEYVNQNSLLPVKLHCGPHGQGGAWVVPGSVLIENDVTGSNTDPVGQINFGRIMVLGVWPQNDNGNNTRFRALLAGTDFHYLNLSDAGAQPVPQNSHQNPLFPPLTK